MKISKKIIFLLPEIYLLVAVLYYWILTANLFNPFAIVLTGLLIFQLTTRNKVTGISIASILILLSFFMLFALVSELNEFPEFNSDAKLLSVVGFSFFGINIIMGSTMLVLNLSAKINAHSLNFK